MMQRTGRKLWPFHCIGEKRTPLTQPARPDNPAYGRMGRGQALSRCPTSNYFASERAMSEKGRCFCFFSAAENCKCFHFTS